MTIDPWSSKWGWMIAGGSEIPIYSYTFSTTNNRQIYRTSDSQGFPRRVPGLTYETVVIKGVEPIDPFTSIFSFTDFAIQFTLGWNYTGGVRKVIDFPGLLTELRFDLNYQNSSEPSFMWTATVLGAISRKSIETVGSHGIFDHIVCSHPLCDKEIRTTDTNHNSGVIRHVKRASLIRTIERLTYSTSESDNHIADTAGVEDTKLELEVQADFDYWFNNLSIVDTAYDYLLFYGPAASDFLLAEKMKITAMENFIVNIRTAELIQANVHLGASYG